MRIKRQCDFKSFEKERAGMSFLKRVFMLLLLPAVISAQSDAPDTSQTRRHKPLVAGGIGDKPFITRLAGRTSVGGYMEALFIYERHAGVTEEVTFEPRRMNLFAYSTLSDRVNFFTEIEFEDGGEEIKVETAVLDFNISESFALRGGILLSPIGKFNLTHDSPRNEVNERPLVSTDLIGVTLSEPGMGIFGALYPGNLRLTYELYAVNGYNDGLITRSALTRIPAGKSSLGEDNNNRPAFAGRLAGRWRNLDAGVSFHTGDYNKFETGGLKIDEARRLTILAIDGEWEWRGLNLRGELARATIEVQKSLLGLYAEEQRGVYAQLSYQLARRFFKLLPLSYFTAVARFDAVDFDSDLEGDSHNRLTLGLNFRPIPDTVFKLDYRRDYFRDRVNTRVDGAAITFGMATYF
jgi:hypothetical protein